MLADDVRPGDTVLLYGQWVKVTRSVRWDRGPAGEYDQPHRSIHGQTVGGREVHEIVNAAEHLESRSN